MPHLADLAGRDLISEAKRLEPLEPLEKARASRENNPVKCTTCLEYLRRRITRLRALVATARDRAGSRRTNGKVTNENESRFFSAMDEHSVTVTSSR